MTTEQFIEQAVSKHGNKYLYSKTEYRGTKHKVCITCMEHGDFWMLPSNHIKGQGCPKCSFTRTTEDFICKAKKVFGDRYDYSKVEYINAQSYVTIICPEHGEYRIRACNHIQGHGCAKCSKNKRYTTESFIELAREVHGNFYDYSETEYVNAKTKVKIICPTHGVFWQIPSNHIKGVRCPHCGGEIGGQKISSNTDEFVGKATNIHGGRYDFSKVVYVSATHKVLVICPLHGEFMMTPQNILAGHGCPICAGNVPLDTKEFVKRSNEIHDNLYDYSETEYINNHEKVCIICHQKNRFGKEHGRFWQNPASHMKGVGCPKCKSSKLEKEVRSILENQRIIFEEQKTFDWLIDVGHMYLDFFLPEYGVGIECQGIQHFVPYEVWGGEDSLKRIQNRDVLKKALCEKHEIEVLYFSNLRIKYPYPVIENIQILLEAIKQRGKIDFRKWEDPELPLEYAD